MIGPTSLAFNCRDLQNRSNSEFNDIEIESEDLLPVKNFLDTVFQAKILIHTSKGNSARCPPYEILLQQLRKKEDPDTLLKVFQCLPNFLDILILSSIFDQIFCHNWNCDAKTNHAVSSLICQIVTRNSSFLHRAFTSLTKSLADPGDNKLSTESDPSRNKEWYVHRTIYEISRQVPTSQTVLFNTMQKNFPPKRFRKLLQVNYVRQMLIICGYVPWVEGKVLEMVIKRCLELDVEIVIEDRCGGLPSVIIKPDLNTSVDEDLYNTSVEADMNFTHEASQESSEVEPSGPPSTNEEERLRWEVSVTADKLDELLVLLMSYLEEKLNDSDVASSDRLIQQLLTIFESRILCAHKTKFIQFVLFFAALKSFKFCTMFLTHLLSLAMSPSQPALKRQCAVMYYSSFVARAAFLPIDYVSDLVGNLIAWAGEYAASVSTNRDLSSEVGALSLDNMTVDEHGLPVSGGGSSKHLLYFSAMQAACYVLCFLGTELALKQRANTKLRQAWEVALSSSLDPLRYCIKSVKWEFLRLSLFTDLVADKGRSTIWNHASRSILLHRRDSISEVSCSAASRRASEDGDLLGSTVRENEAIEAAPDARAGAEGTDETKLRRMRSVSFASDLSPTPAKYSSAARPRGLSAELAAVTSFNPLDSFFPFDPCLLKLAHGMVASYYRSWDGVPGLDRGWVPGWRDATADRDGDTEEPVNQDDNTTDDDGLGDDDKKGLDKEEHAVDECDEDDDDDDDEDNEEESRTEDQAGGDGNHDGQDPFLRQYRGSGINNMKVDVSLDGGNEFLLNGVLSEDALSMYAGGTGKRCSPIVASANEGVQRRRRLYSISSSADW